MLRRPLALILAAGATGASACGDDGPPRPGTGAGASAGAPAATATPAPRAPETPIERAVGSLIVLRFNGPALPAYAARALREGRAAGAVLFADNLASPAQLRGLARSIRRAGGGRGLVLADQEGGEVRIVPWAGPERSPTAQLAAGSVEPDSRTAGRELRRAGIDVVLAPVADAAQPGSALRGRGFGADAAAAGRAAAEAVAGFAAGGVAPTLKHFPGLGRAQANTDDAPATIPGAPELAAFRPAIRAGVPLVMVSHATYPALDPERIASQSKAVATDLLRGELGFEGVAVTDSMEADAVVSRGEVDVAAERSVRAGMDLLLTTGRGSALRIYRRLLATARRSPAFARRVREAARRVEALPRRRSG